MSGARRSDQDGDIREAGKPTAAEAELPAEGRAVRAEPEPDQ
jgi:hypothetical protein